MHATRFRLIAALMVLAVAVLGTGITNAATTTFPGSIRVTSPISREAYRAGIEIDWVWRSGSLVRSTSTVDLAYTSNGLRWSTIATAVPIRQGTFLWDTANPQRRVRDGLYSVRATVRGTTIRSAVGSVFIDNTSPTIEIVRPATTDVVVDDETLASVRYVIGRFTVGANASDAFTGITGVSWLLDGDPLGTGISYTHDFNSIPGMHTLTAVTADRAGNTAEHSVEVLVLPGPSATGSAPQVSPPAIPEPPATPSPDVPAPPEQPPAEPPAVPLPEITVPPLPEL